jgi:hypothetical protein
MHDGCGTKRLIRSAIRSGTAVAVVDALHLAAAAILGQAGRIGSVGHAVIETAATF